MDQRLMCGPQGSYCTYWWAEYLPSGQVTHAPKMKQVCDKVVRQKTLLRWFSFFLSPETQQGIFDAVLKGHIDFDSDPWPLISDSAKDLIRSMLCSRPSERLTAHQVLSMYSNQQFLHVSAMYLLSYPAKTFCRASLDLWKWSCARQSTRSCGAFSS